MDNQTHLDKPVPPDCFQQAEIELFQSLENETLSRVHYYPWLNLDDKASAQPYRFLLALELTFESGKSLLLSSGDDSEAIQVIAADKLLETAHRLQQLNGQPTIQRLLRNEHGFWVNLTGNVLQSVQLSKHQNGLYRNDALMLDFGSTGIIIELQEDGEGSLIRAV